MPGPHPGITDDLPGPGTPVTGRTATATGEASGSVNRWPRYCCAEPSTCQHLRKWPVSWMFAALRAYLLVSRCGT